KKHYPLLLVEIIKPAKSDFFDFDAKYSGQSDEVCPGNFTQEESEQLQRLAMIAHECLGLRHYSRSDFLLTPRRGIYILEVNTLPGLTEESLFPKSLYAVGSSLSNFLDHLISLALEKPGN
ncbi:MAG TPA: D-alanine--D-alanine ligase, partial [Acidobacteriota bacterium]|nr:D-alanine--D-alanine ligase [Acidobacteriota bacterium]